VKHEPSEIKLCLVLYNYSKLIVDNSQGWFWTLVRVYGSILSTMADFVYFFVKRLPYDNLCVCH